MALKCPRMNIDSTSKGDLLVTCRKKSVFLVECRKETFYYDSNERAQYELIEVTYFKAFLEYRPKP